MSVGLEELLDESALPLRVHGIFLKGKIPGILARISLLLERPPKTKLRLSRIFFHITPRTDYATIGKTEECIGRKGEIIRRISRKTTLRKTLWR